MIIDPVVRGGLGSGVGGLRWLTGVLIVDLREVKDATTPSTCGGGPNSEVGNPSCEFEGGVGGRPLSAAFRAVGDSIGVGSWLLLWESVSSSTAAVSSLNGAAAGSMVWSSRGRGSGLWERRFGDAAKEDSSKAYAPDWDSGILVGDVAHEDVIKWPALCLRWAEDFKAPSPVGAER